MDKLDKEIEAKARERDAVKDRVTTLRAQIDDITRKHDEAAATLRDYEIELRALTHAASLRPIAPTNDAVATPDVVEPRRGGRQKGSISKKWRRALADLVAAGNQPMDPERFYLLTRGRLGLAESSVKERVRTYVTAGHLEEVNGRLCVTQEAISKFGLDRPAAIDSEPDDDGDTDDEKSYPPPAEGAHNEKAPH